MIFQPWDQALLESFQSLDVIFRNQNEQQEDWLGVIILDWKRASDELSPEALKAYFKSIDYEIELSQW